uniref:ATP synthase F0 subunit 8 n=1 Tax=Hybos grossipes TaxID=1446182 RepID=UPI00207B07DF|nr:ATP synthase F0 subunit 8 [Hybos grossipes]URT60152.1 ATP synthase F0 subunit 8 [Hybos grossipes]
MPQMAPIGWLNLFILFTIIFILFCIMNYYMFIPAPNTQKLSHKKMSNPMNWKW